MAALASCRRNDFRTITIDVPGMKSDARVAIVSNKVRQIQGVQSAPILIDRERRSVTVTYDSLVLSLKNIEATIAEAGFDANDVPAKPAAAKALPP
jgi:copper chaperone CopZ